MSTSTLRRAAQHASATELERIARRYALNPNLDVLLRGTSDRTWARLADDSGAEVWLMSWPEGAETGWHDHGGSVGAFAVATGNLVEETWSTQGSQERALGPGDSRTFGEEQVHNVRGVAVGRSLTVHACAPRLVTMTRHELTPAGLRPVLTSREGGQW
ncbi:MAG: hypothetical protein ABI890_14495 [Lapillicoccus sp.]